MIDPAAILRRLDAFRARFNADLDELRAGLVDETDRLAEVIGELYDTTAGQPFAVRDLLRDMAARPGWRLNVLLQRDGLNTPQALGLFLAKHDGSTVRGIGVERVGPSRNPALWRLSDRLGA